MEVQQLRSLASSDTLTTGVSLPCIGLEIDNQDVHASRGSEPSNKIQDITTLHSPKQCIWLRTAVDGDRCRRMALYAVASCMLEAATSYARARSNPLFESLLTVLCQSQTVVHSPSFHVTSFLDVCTPRNHIMTQLIQFEAQLHRGTRTADLGAVPL